MKLFRYAIAFGLTAALMSGLARAELLSKEEWVKKGCEERMLKVDGDMRVFDQEMRTWLEHLSTKFKFTDLDQASTVQLTQLEREAEAILAGSATMHQELDALVQDGCAPPDPVNSARQEKALAKMAQMLAQVRSKLAQRQAE